MSLTSYSGSLLAGLITSQLPIEDPSTRLTAGLLINETMQRVSNKVLNIDVGKYIYRWLRWNDKNQIFISEYVNPPGESTSSKLNPIYYKMEDFLISKFLDKMNSCELVPKKGDYVFTIDPSSLDKEDFQETFQDKDGVEHLVTFKLHRVNHQYTSFGGRSSGDSGSTGQKNQIVLESKTAHLDVLKEYCQNLVSKLDQSTNEILRIHRTMIGSKEGSEPYWDTVYVKTNKSKKNTILSDEIKHELFDDVDWFLNNEEWYASKGIPYKRGYVLHGPPGCGKSSAIKSMASTYGLDIFSLELASIRSNSQLIKITSEINYLSAHKKFILAIEDADKSKFFKDKWQRNITVDCFINCLDGIVEPYGQITVITANDVQPIVDVAALTRPGRIDKILNITYCNPGQIKKLLETFYDEEEVELDASRLKVGQLTPADLIKVMQKFPDNLNAVIALLYGESGPIEVLHEKEELEEITNQDLADIQLRGGRSGGIFTRARAVANKSPARPKVSINAASILESTNNNNGNGPGNGNSLAAILGKDSNVTGQKRKRRPPEVILRDDQELLKSVKNQKRCFENRVKRYKRDEEKYQKIVDQKEERINKLQEKINKNKKRIQETKAKERAKAKKAK